MKTIVALRRGGLGDLLIAAPSLQLMRLAYPDARIILLARPLYASLFQAAALIDEVRDADDFMWAALSGPAAIPQAELPAADLAVGWFHTASADAFEKGAARLWPNIPIHAFRAGPRSESPLSRQFFELTTRSLPESKISRPSFEDCSRLQIKSKGLSAERKPSDPYAVIHPGAGSPRKVWPVDRFREIIRVLASRGFSGAIVLGEAELPVREEWFAAALPSGWSIRNCPDLLSLAGLLSGASFYLGNDSGVTHLAAALGIPGFAIFLAEFVTAWRPLGKIEAISAAEIRGVSVASVLRRTDFYMRIL